MKQHLLTILLLLLMAASSCVHDPNAVDALDRAELLIEDAPDSALLSLETIDPEAIARDRSLYPRYALLITQARYKNFIDETSDSLISIALDHYTGSLSLREVKACYYAGTINLNNHNHEKALRLGLTAQDLASQLADTLWIARSSELIADIFHLNHLHDEAIAYSTIARNCYRAIGKTNNELTACIDIAIYNYNLGLYKKSQLQLDSIETLNKSKQFTNIPTLCARALLPAYIKLNKPDKAVESFNRYLSLEDEPVSSQVFMYAAKAWLNLGELTKSSEMLDSALSRPLNLNDSVLLFEIQAINLYKNKEYDAAFLKMQECASIDDSTGIVLKKQSALRVQNDYILEKAEISQQKSSTRINMLVIIILICIVLFLSIYSYTIIKKKREFSFIEAQLAEFRDLYEEGITINKTIIQQHKSDSDILYNRMHELLKKQFMVVNSLCAQYWENSDSPTDDKLLVKKFKTELEKIKSVDYINSIKKIVNDTLDNFLLHLHQDVPNLNEVELTIIALICAGFSSRLICIVLNLKSPTFYTKRNRIKKKIAQLPSEIANKYLSKLNMSK